MVVDVGEGARGALGHRGDRYPVGGRIHTPAESANWWGGHAAYYGQVGPRVIRIVDRPAIARRASYSGRTAVRPIRRIPECSISIWYGSEGLHQAVAPAIGV